MDLSQINSVNDLLAANEQTQTPEEERMQVAAEVLDGLNPNQAKGVACVILNKLAEWHANMTQKQEEPNKAAAWAHDLALLRVSLESLKQVDL